MTFDVAGSASPGITLKNAAPTSITVTDVATSTNGASWLDVRDSAMSRRSASRLRSGRPPVGRSTPRSRRSIRSAMRPRATAPLRTVSSSAGPRTARAPLQDTRLPGSGGRPLVGQSEVTFSPNGTAKITLYKADTSTTVTVTDVASTKSGSTGSFAVADAGIDHFVVRTPALVWRGPSTCRSPRSTCMAIRRLSFRKPMRDVRWSEQQPSPS